MSVQAVFLPLQRQNVNSEMSPTAYHILSLVAFLVTATQIAHMAQNCMVPSQLTCSMRAELCSLYISGGGGTTNALKLTAYSFHLLFTNT